MKTNWRIVWLSLLVGTIGFVPPAQANLNEADLGVAILDCFHPVSRFRSVSLGNPYTRNGYQVIDGTVNFRGSWTNNLYYMDFSILIREVNGTEEFKVIPGTDTAPFPPDSDCRMRSWTEIE